MPWSSASMKWVAQHNLVSRACIFSGLQQRMKPHTMEKKDFLFPCYRSGIGVAAYNDLHDSGYSRAFVRETDLK